LAKTGLRLLHSGYLVRHAVTRGAAHFAGFESGLSDTGGENETTDQIEAAQRLGEQAKAEVRLMLSGDEQDPRTSYMVVGWRFPTLRRPARTA
jgi:hypothetical protein